MTAYVDRIRFASGDNPVTTIELRVGRGERLLSDTANPDVERSEDVNLPNIIAGKNASGKTSLLRGLVEIDRLLQRGTISAEESRRVKSELQKMGITTLEIQYSVHLGNNTPFRYPGLLGGPRYPGDFSVFERFSRHRLPVTLETRPVDSPPNQFPKSGYLIQEMNRSAIELEQLIQIKMEASDESETLRWRDGLRLRRIGEKASSEFTTYYRKHGPLEENKAVGRFRLCKSKSAIGNLLNEHLETEIFGEILSRYTVSEPPKETFQFQPIELITVDRDASKEEVEKIRMNFPSITKTLLRWKEDPEAFRELLMSRKEGNRLLALMGLKTSDLMEERVEEGCWKLWDYAPDVIEHLMMWPELVHYYTWFSDGTFASKQAGLDFVMEGIVHDIVYFVTGIPNTRRKIESNEVENRSRQMVHELSWVDADEGLEARFRNGKVGQTYTPIHPHYPHNPLANPDLRIEPPGLTNVLRELPFLSDFLGMQHEDQAMVDILARFNRFSSTEAIKSGYLSSGQQQILSLIAAVRRVKSGSLILIDEPEISLHMDWQEIVIAELQAPLDGSRLLVATHSPDIVVRHRHLCTTIETTEEGGIDRGQA